MGIKNVIYIDPTKAFGSSGGITTDAPVVGLKLWETGFYPIYTRLTADELNELNRGPLSQEVIDAAIVGSLVGWSVPGAEAAVVHLLGAEAARVALA